MVFAAPFWLIALAPWAALAVWVLVGRRRRQWVPFLALWEAPEELRKPKKGMEWPPLAVVLTVLAALLGVLAAAQPLLSVKGSRKLTVIVDRGGSMSARSAGEARFVAACRLVHQKLAREGQPIEIRMLTVPDGGEWVGTLDKWLGAVGQLRRTAVGTDVQSSLGAIAKDEPVLVITDQPVSPSPAREMMAPAGAAGVRNIAITALAARHGQVMVRLSSTVPVSATCEIRSGATRVQREVSFTSPGMQDLFVELPAPDQVIEAILNTDDDFEADNRAWLVRRGQWPMIERRLPVSEELERLLAVYSRHRPAGDGSPRIILARGGDLKADEPGIIIEVPSGESQSGIATVIEDHPITAAVDFAPLRTGVVLSDRLPGEGWRTILRVGGKAALAVSEGETRRAWVGFDCAPLARTPSFVVLWTNLLDWVAGASTGYVSSALDDSVSRFARRLPEALPEDADPRYWPGVFDTASGPQAANAAPLTIGVGGGDSLDQLKLNVRQGFSLVPWLLLLAVAALAGAAATLERRRIARPVAAQHLAVQDEMAVQTSVEADGHVHQHSAPRSTP